MKVLLFGTSGMVGQGVLRECLRAPDVSKVISVSRRKTNPSDQKLDETVHEDFSNFDAVSERWKDVDACFYCLGVSSSGLSEARYTEVTYAYAVAAARALHAQNPAATFVFVSGAGTNPESKTMWSRVKGRAEQDILKMGFERAVAFRPSFIEPRHGIKSQTPSYRWLYAVLGPLSPLLRAVAPNHITSTEHVGRAMLNAARGKVASGSILENREINALADA
jgi:uncharacterized protein YbjT (DUF2867 family)